MVYTCMCSQALLIHTYMLGTQDAEAGEFCEFEDILGNTHTHTPHTCAHTDIIPALETGGLL